MSQANVEIVKRAIDAFNRRDLNVYDELWTPDFEWFPAMAGIVDGDSFRGREGMARNYEVLGDIWEEFRVVGEEFRDLGDRVLGLGRLDGRGRGSGTPVDAPFRAVFDFRDGKISRARSYLDHGEALRAAGLSE
jgi:ketosteroid isomerase-like protein